MGKIMDEKEQKDSFWDKLFNIYYNIRIATGIIILLIALCEKCSNG